MGETWFFDGLIVLWFGLAGLTLPALFWVAAPYGRHARRGWGPTIDARLGWIVMEAPAPLVFGVCFLLGDDVRTVTALVFLALWELHYVHRAFIYPLGLRERGRRMPVAVAGLGLLFNAGNGYLNGHALFSLSGGYPASWLGDPRFLSGLALFALGFVVNRRADRTLRSLREPGQLGYGIPRGGLYRWISCPNYLGEIIEWAGWAVATWSVAGLAFAAWTAANLVPRAWSHHCWYRERFPDYPAGRKALLPGVW